MIAPMRQELTSLGIGELRSAEQVDTFLAANQDRTAMIVVNSVCGCAAGSLRPALTMALHHRVRPDGAASVFAGQDLEATAHAREHFAPFPPSSPAVALFLRGRLAFMLERHQIQGRHPEDVAQALTAAFDAHCAPAANREIAG
ncbi:MAG: BrxA/BrxB family bacilliredoxin [Gemmatimonadetes bacterium]|nr:BrxA/BrxB family bacilliredoxin [Gemmatimonadota bacterium]